MAQDHRPLLGLTVGVTAARRAEELGGLLERRGARVVYGPAIRSVALADDDRLAAATDAVLAAPVDLVVAITGVGFRGWLDTAEGRGRREGLLGRLGAAEVLARGPKARGAVRGAGLPDPWTAGSETVAEVLDELLRRDLDGRRIAVQEQGEPMTEFCEALRRRGAEVIPVGVYRWTDPEDVGPLDSLIDAVARAEVHALTFTSAPAATNLLRRAERTGRGEPLRRALRTSCLVACVGPVTAAPLEREGLPVRTPDRPRTGALARQLERELPTFVAATGAG
ncbi:uroporphyrinogen-III synthase [Actinoalloteichus sp. AHMU CJ021]|uniref:Uroporphyrinogen-III synthase n=1 Tax=Actinoalloteichus caeruleus DSM 43889 TaxID=1120930 RepID=A0ABT1JIA0_ACTCY|nr:uroporphyrinogen-III synthase [Actinoalloteichus caeruleus]AUS78202.1 uroporphyrinogen-III synthase [Actinoalloteichus sp. AHMU CJ021]MCP2332240.1 uroporphyrinogen-III synthase [Actinoalloteichus caeruleus DSM 43889]